MMGFVKMNVIMPYIVMLRVAVLGVISPVNKVTGVRLVIEYGEIRTSDNFEVRMMGAVEVSKSIWLTFGSDADEVESRTPARSDKVMMSLKCGQN